MTARASAITDWNTREDELPDVEPGAEYERLYASQKFIVLRRVVVRGMALARLQIGAVEVPFELESTGDLTRTYRPTGLDEENLKRLLVKAGAAVATKDSIAIAPTLEIRVVLRNDGGAAIKPRAALIVQEEVGR
jgi:hypothetical protein